MSKKDILSSGKMKEKRFREHMVLLERIQWALELWKNTEIAERECHERECVQIMYEQEECLQREREQLEIER